jgi:hypothetical protein
MKISHLIASLDTVVESFPEAEFELGFCSCCIYIKIEGKRIAVFNVEENEFEYLEQCPPLLPPDLVAGLSPFKRD